MTIYQYLMNNTLSKFDLSWSIPILFSNWLPAIIKSNSYHWLSFMFYCFFYIYQKIFFFKIYNKPVMLNKDSLIIDERDIFLTFFIVTSFKLMLYVYNHKIDLRGIYDPTYN